MSERPYNWDNQSAHINPFLYGGGGTIDVVFVECGHCGKRSEHKASHSERDVDLARRFWPKWIILGVRGAKRTRCPKCRHVRAAPKEAADD